MKAYLTLAVALLTCLIIAQKAKPVVKTFDEIQRTKALKNVKSCAIAIAIYQADHDDVIPYVTTSAGLERVVHPYIKNKDVWKTLNPKGTGRFQFNLSLAGVMATAIADPAITPLLYDGTAYPDGKFLSAYADIHAKYESAATWKERQKNLKLKLKKTGKPIKGG
ncbi:MAG: hypothetical protein ABL962_10210 [Fimbriimonadaceae bacterium]